jgi:hypothetical protein
MTLKADAHSKWLLSLVASALLFLAWHGTQRLIEGAELGHRVPAIATEVRVIHRKVNALMLKQGMNPALYEHGEGDSEVRTSGN